MPEMEKYYQGETYESKAHVTDADDADTDPSTITITIEDSIGTKKITAQAMDKDAVGYYHYDYIIPADAELGRWKSEVKATKTNVAIEHDEFEVIAAL